MTSRGRERPLAQAPEEIKLARIIRAGDEVEDAVGVEVHELWTGTDASVDGHLGLDPARLQVHRRGVPRLAVGPHVPVEPEEAAEVAHDEVAAAVAIDILDPGAGMAPVAARCRSPRRRPGAGPGARRGPPRPSSARPSGGPGECPSNRPRRRPEGQRPRPSGPHARSGSSLVLRRSSHRAPIASIPSRPSPAAPRSPGTTVVEADRPARRTLEWGGPGGYWWAGTGWLRRTDDAITSGLARRERRRGPRGTTHDARRPGFRRPGPGVPTRGDPGGSGRSTCSSSGRSTRSRGS